MSDTPKPEPRIDFIWRGEVLVTIGDLMRGMESCATIEEAHEFMSAYRAVSPHAGANIGYLTGYYDSVTAQRYREWFGVSHPIFGRETPSMEKAFEAGKRAALGEFNV